jgi:hypothetical protein
MQEVRSIICILVLGYFYEVIPTADLLKIRQKIQILFANTFFIKLFFWNLDMINIIQMTIMGLLDQLFTGPCITRKQLRYFGKLHCLGSGVFVSNMGHNSKLEKTMINV